jgi:hypothetical protein
VSDQSQLQVRPKDDGSALNVSKVRSGLIARGRRDAEVLLLGAPTGRLRNARQLAEEGDIRAQFELGDAYYQGDGVPKDYGEAHVWFRKAAEQFHLYANLNLGDMYEAGRGVPADRAEAVNYYFKAADIALAYNENDESRDWWDPDWVIYAIEVGAKHGHAKAREVAIVIQQLKEQRRAPSEAPLPLRERDG